MIPLNEIKRYYDNPYKQGVVRRKCCEGKRCCLSFKITIPNINIKGEKLVEDLKGKKNAQEVSDCIILFENNKVLLIEVKEVFYREHLEKIESQLMGGKIITEELLSSYCDIKTINYFYGILMERSNDKITTLEKKARTVKRSRDKPYPIEFFKSGNNESDINSERIKSFIC